MTGAGPEDTLDRCGRREASAREDRIRGLGQPGCGARCARAPVGASQLRLARACERRGGQSDHRFGCNGDRRGSPAGMPDASERYGAFRKKPQEGPALRSRFSGFCHERMVAGIPAPMRSVFVQIRRPSAEATSVTFLRPPPAEPHRAARGRTLVRRLQQDSARRSQQGAPIAWPDHEFGSRRRPYRHQPDPGHQEESSQETNPVPVWRGDRPVAPYPGPARRRTTLSTRASRHHSPASPDGLPERRDPEAEMVRGRRPVLRLAETKTGPRQVWLSEAAQAIIAHQPRTASAYVFPSPKFPARPCSSAMGLWYQARKEAGIDDVRLHDLRHTVASQAVAQGVALSTVARMLGHSDPTMTLRYAHVSDREVEAAAERIGKVIERAMANGE